MDINRVQLKGRLGKDPRHHIFDNGGQVAAFSMATSKRYKNKEGETLEKTMWHQVKVFGKTAEVVRDYLKKGHEVFVEGEVEYREWVDEKTGAKREGAEIIVKNLSLLTRTTREGENVSDVSDQNTPEFTTQDIPF